MDKKDIKDQKKVIKDNLEKLHILRDQGYEEFISDFRNIDSGISRLQSSIAALREIENHIVSLFNLEAPPSNEEGFKRLKEAGNISKDKIRTYEQMLYFKERVRKLSDRMDTKKLYNIVRDELESIEDFYKNLGSIVKAHKKNLANRTE
ncbi:MAG: DUF86 domain-containing protein [Thermodesulfobacteriota bacterium]